MHKLQIWDFAKRTLHATHRLKLLDKMCKCEMDPASIVEGTEWIRFCPQWQTDGQTDGQRETSIPPFQLRWRRSIIINWTWSGVSAVSKHKTDLKIVVYLPRCFRSQSITHLCSAMVTNPAFETAISFHSFPSLPTPEVVEISCAANDEIFFKIRHFHSDAPTLTLLSTDLSWG